MNMQNHPFNLAHLLDFAGKYHPTQKVITRRVEDDKIVEHTYKEVLSRAKRLANALIKLGASPGDCIGTIALNTHRHMESWYGISGQGCISHTINPRLSMKQLHYIVNHAEDKFILIDPIFWPIIEGMHSKFPKVEGYIVLTEKENMPKTEVPNVYCYEELLESSTDDYTWPEFDPHQGSSLCYTSGTTGDPKGVMYTHISNLWHAYALSLSDAIAVGAQDTILVVVPLFHANSWGLAYAGPMIGCNLIMPGKRMDGQAIFELIDKYQATTAAGVPTVWTNLLEYADASGRIMESLKDVVVGGSAAPPSMFTRFREKHDIDLIHAWGMTEMSPLGTINRPSGGIMSLPDKDYRRIRRKQGRPIFGVDIKIVNDQGEELPRDGKEVGRLLVKGNWVVHTYFKAEQPAIDGDGWFDTGDMATIDPYGYMEIIDRAKDLIKSGGEWISSVDMENHAMGHEEVSLAAAIAINHDKWGERPLLIVVPKEGHKPSKESLLTHLSSEFSKWQLPDDVIFVEEIPLTATGKFSKLSLREQFKGHFG